MFRPSPDYIVQDRKQQRDPDRPRNYSVDRPSCTIHTDTRLWLLEDLEKANPVWFKKHRPRHIDQPVNTILAGDKGRVDKVITDNKHARKLTLVELAILQGFPPRYRFVGSKGKQIEQIGNALPPAVTKAFVAPLVMVKA